MAIELPPFKWTLVVDDLPDEVPYVTFPGPVNVIVPTTRYGEVEQTFTLKAFDAYGKVEPVTLRQILVTIHRFYLEDVSMKQVLEYQKKVEDDIYLEDAIEHLKDHPNVGYPRHKLMGDCLFYEGLTRQPDGSCVLNLGS